MVVAPNGISWSDARTIACMLGGDLASVESDAENVFIFLIAAGVEGAWTTTPLGHGRSVVLGPWLGGLQLDEKHEPSGSWAWVTGAPIGARGEKGVWWAEREPNNRPDRSGGGDENRLCFIGIDAKPSPFWNDAEETPRGTGGEPGVRVTSFVVEYPAPGE